MPKAIDFQMYNIISDAEKRFSAGNIRMIIYDGRRGTASVTRVDGCVESFSNPYTKHTLIIARTDKGMYLISELNGQLEVISKETYPSLASYKYEYYGEFK